MVLKAVQQFQVRSVLNSEANARDTLHAIKDAGYDGIELCGFLISKIPPIIRLLARAAGMPIGRSGKLDWCSLIKESGLKVISIHEDLNSILKNPFSIAERAKSFGTDIVVITGMMKYDYANVQAVLSLAEKLNRAGSLLKENGIRLLYHNHNCELSKIEGKYALRVLMEETNPEYVNFEFDSYWPAEAGCDPLALMHMLGNRMKLYHINDRGFRSGKPSSSIRKSDSMELGTGNMNLKALVDAAKGYGVEGIILESHKNWAENSPVKSLQISAKFMNEYM